MAVTAQVPETSVTFKVVPPEMVQPVERPTSKVTEPVPEPPVLESVEVVP